MEESNKVEGSEVALNIFDSHAKTSRSISHYRFKWTLNDFSRLTFPINGSRFELPGVCCITVQLTIGTDSCLCISNLVPERYSTCDINWSFHIYDSNCKLLKGTKCILDFSMTYTSGLKKNSLICDTIIIICEYSIHGNIKTEFWNCQHPAAVQCSAQEKLVLDLKTMYEKNSHTDVILKVNTNDAIRAHKVILCARSPVFEKMFEHQLKERDQNVVPIEDVAMPTLRKFLDFLYTGTVETGEDTEAVYALYYVADKYEVLDLRKFCADAMLSEVTVENALKIAVWADRHDDEFLTTDILKFISINLGTIIESDSWEPFILSHGKLAAQVTKYCATKS